MTRYVSPPTSQITVCPSSIASLGARSSSRFVSPPKSPAPADVTVFPFRRTVIAAAVEMSAVTVLWSSSAISSVLKSSLPALSRS